MNTGVLTEGFLDDSRYDGLQDLTVGCQARIGVDLDQPNLPSQNASFRRHNRLENNVFKTTKMHSNASARTIYLHIFVNKKVEAIEVEVADTRFQSVLHGKEAIKHDVLHAILQRNIHYSGLLCQDFTVQMVFGRPFCKTVRPMLSDRCPSVCPVCMSVLSVCYVGVLWSNGWTDKARPHCVRWGPSSPPKRGTAPQFSAHVCCGKKAE